jgi:hypothetical protein
VVAAWLEQVAYATGLLYSFCILLYGFSYMYVKRVVRGYAKNTYKDNGNIIEGRSGRSVRSVRSKASKLYDII